MNLKSYLPILEWIKTYNKDTFKRDLIAGLTVGVMLIPQGMAYAMLAGLPPIYGLYASTLPLIIYAILGTSRQLAVGPVAMVSLLTASGIGVMAEAGTATYISLAIALAALVGLIQFLLGVLRLGFLVNFLSHPVISGFTSAAALIIGLSQLKHLLGIDLARSHHIHEIILQAVEQFGNLNWPTVGIGVGGILLIIVVKKINKAIPGSLLAVLFSILAVWALGLTDAGIAIVGEIPRGLPTFNLPTFSWETTWALLPTALAISLVSFMESIAVAKAIQAKHKNYQVVPNQELIALGLANLGGALFQSYPVTGGFSRTAVNDQAGAKTGLASVISAVLIILTLLFLTPLFYYLPKAILASVIMVAIFGLIDWKEPLHLWKTDRSDFWMLIATFIGTLTLGIESGIGLGVVLSLAMIIYETTRPHMVRLGQVPDTPFYRNVERFENMSERPDTLIVRFDARLYFANIQFFQDKLAEWIAQKGDQLQTIIINAEGMNSLDSSALHLLEEIVKEQRAKGRNVFFSGVKGPVRDLLVRAGLFAKIGADNFFMTVQEAVDYHVENRVGTPADFQEYTMQTNIS
ncbi:MAG: solute carrier 26 family protein [Bacteroidetes bacterium]|nr:MAG: solute carrier 26 family protein [Bacteroidota bacterium]